MAREFIEIVVDFFDQARRGGLASLEAEIEEPSKSKTQPAIGKDHLISAFICDTFRTTMIGGMEPFDVDQMLETDIEVLHHEGVEQAGALTTVADSLPGLGIVAAVLGVGITMGALGGKPEEIGHKVAAALVGTFLGILMCYRLVGPLAANMAKTHEAERAYYHMLRVAMSAFNKGIPPLLAVEVGRHLCTSGGRSRKWKKPAANAALRPSPRPPERGSRGRSTQYHQKEGGAWRPPWRRLESGLRRFRNCHDGSIHRAWLMNTSKEIQEAVGGYFRDPKGTSKAIGSGETAAGDSFTLSRDNMDKLKDELQQAIRKSVNFDKLKDNIEMTITPEGLRIELLESAMGTFFQSGVAAPHRQRQGILVKLAQELGKLPNKVSIEGHTNSKPVCRAR